MFYLLYNIYIEPMRNWNLSSIHLIISSGAIYIEPMRNWNLNKLRKLTLFVTFILNLWGIETEKGKMKKLLDWIFILNLWGIETNWNKSVINWLYIFILNLWGIETAITQDLKNKGFDLYWTYEELKLLIENKNKLQLTIIYIEPMRNWNYNFKKESKENATIYIEPMRNWNKIFSIY